MPKFGVVPLNHLWNNLSENALGIYLEKGEAVNDALLDKIDQCSRHIYITNVHGNREPLRITCSPKALGTINPKTLCFMGVLEELDDCLFQYCWALETIWMGASGHQPLLTLAPYLSQCPLKRMGFNGWGIVILGDALEQLASKVKKDSGQVMFIY